MPGENGTVKGAGGGYNGGGNAQIWKADSESQRCGGGGATDIRTIISVWDDSTSLQSRIMVAGGGGGYSTDNTYDVDSAAGGLIGYSGSVYSSGTGGTQLSGGSGYTGKYGTSKNGGFGTGD